MRRRNMRASCMSGSLWQHGSCLPVICSVWHVHCLLASSANSWVVVLLAGGDRPALLLQKGDHGAGRQEAAKDAGQGGVVDCMPCCCAWMHNSSWVTISTPRWYLQALPEGHRITASMCNASDARTNLRMQHASKRRGDACMMQAQAHRAPCMFAQASLRAGSSRVALNEQDRLPTMACDSSCCIVIVKVFFRVHMTFHAVMQRL